MAVHIPQVVAAAGLRADLVAARAGMTARYYYRRVMGHAAWGEADVDRLLAALHDIGGELRALRRRDLVDPGTPLKPTGRTLLRPKK